jgi:hypothetical protein
MPPADGKSVAPLVDALPVLACFYYTALFAVARDVVAPFRATNPTWVKKPPALANRVGPSWETISARFVSAVGDFSSKLSIDDSTAGISTVVTGSATDLPLESGGFAGAVTSPPYATRIDYVKNSLPELAILGFRPHEVAALRKRTTGSPVVRGLEMKETPLISRYGNSVLRKIGSHDSKGSKA